MDADIDILNTVASGIWNPLFFLLIAAGIFLTVRLKGLQFRYLGFALQQALLPGATSDDTKAEGDISHFQSLMTSLAATIGIGNIAGVASAIALGGLGALFWLWVVALIGMAIKFAEAVLAIRYRTVDERKEMSGGPMYYIEKGLKSKKLALFFSFFGAIAALLTGNIIQSNSISQAMTNVLPLNPWVIGLVLSVLTAGVLVKGIQSIGSVTSFLVPFMAVLYILGSLAILVLNFGKLPEVFGLIIKSAFTGQAAIGGFAGSTMMLAIRMGVSRGIFSNESGLGSAPIAAAAAKTSHPSRQALISMSGGFLSTVVCTFTGLVLGVTQVLGEVGPDGNVLNGALMTVSAFERALPYGGWIVLIGSIFFGFSTIIGWAYYGEKCCEYMLGWRSVPVYRSVFSLMVFVGVFVPLDLAWVLADLANSLMVLPNLLAVVVLAGVVVKEKDRFFGEIPRPA